MEDGSVFMGMVEEGSLHTHPPYSAVTECFQRVIIIEPLFLGCFARLGELIQSLL